MTLKEKSAAFIRQHGYGYRSYALSVLLFPPAAVFIAWKKPGIPTPWRVMLSIIPMAAPPALGVAIAMLLKLAFFR